MGLLNTLKYHGRGVVLPVEEMKALIQRAMKARNITHVTDFGAGTLFWSQWFAGALQLTVAAVDTAYTHDAPRNMYPGISMHANIDDVLALRKNSGENSAIFICDVIHHLPPALWQSLFIQITEIFDLIIIKDIDANAKVGNFLNKMHDRIINGEKINNVYPGHIESHLARHGFATQINKMPKLWYPHFMITGAKGAAQ
ncbi:MAG: hypothetical protein FWB88_07460 [Defluviitaleaceae bacterium]|nr:hypothetical protein [Defluviitaleaceae bacterium]MCL2239322.1 hypothetical protein [Defluviitaleaceae bacterium]